MAYKIANIKWLRDQGWSISSSYASGFCPTYNEIVNEIPKDSTTVDVNGTCIATSKAYTNNQLVCESDISIGSNCSVYEFSSIETPLETHVTTPIAYSLRSLEQLTYTIMSSGGFLTGITVVSTSDRWQYMGVFNTTTSTSDRTATIEYRNGDGTCTFTQQLVMKGEIDCSVYNWTQYTDTLEPSETSYLLATSNSQQSALNVQVVDSGGFVEGVEVILYSPDKYDYVGHYLENTTTSPRQATIKYTSSDGCEWTQVVTQKGAVDCSAYGFVDRNISVASSSGTPIVAESLSSANTLTFSRSDSSNWITFNSVETFRNKMYICNVTENTSQDIRIGFAVFTSSDGCEFTATVTQSGKTQQTYEIGYILTSTRTRFRTPINYINGSASIFTQSELSTAIDIIPYIEPESGCEALAVKTITLADLLALEVGNQLYEDVVGTNLCIVSGIRISVPTDPTNIRERIVLTQRG